MYIVHKHLVVVGHVPVVLLHAGPICNRRGMYNVHKHLVVVGHVPVVFLHGGQPSVIEEVCTLYINIQLW